jgi:hypothetical protein
MPRRDEPEFVGIIAEVELRGKTLRSYRVMKLGVMLGEYTGGVPLDILGFSTRTGDRFGVTVTRLASKATVNARLPKVKVRPRARAKAGRGR